MKALKAYNTETMNRFHQRKVHNTEVVDIPQDDPHEPPVPDNGPSDLPESNLDIPDYPIVNFVNSQVHEATTANQWHGIAINGVDPLFATNLDRSIIN